MRDFYDDEEPEVDLLSLDDVNEGDDDMYDNSDWTGRTADFDGEALIDNLLSGDCE